MHIILQTFCDIFTYQINNNNKVSQWLAATMLSLYEVKTKLMVFQMYTKSCGLSWCT